MKDTPTQNQKRTRKILFKRNWLALSHVVDSRGRTSYELEFYQLGNRKYTKTISYDEKTALKSWHANYADIPKLDHDHEKKIWIEARFFSPPRRGSGAKKEENLTLGPSPLARKFEEYVSIQWQKPIERSSKVTVLRICRELLKHSGKNETLTPQAVKGFFKKRMHPNHHQSPDTLQSDRTEIRRLATWLGIRELDGLFKDIYFPTHAQLKDHGIEFNSLNRRHLERLEVLKFTEKLVQLNEPERKPERDALIIQLLFGSRPQEAPCAEILSSSIVISGSWKHGKKKSIKTASHGVDTIIIPRNPLIDAILFITDCQPKPVVSNNACEVFKTIAKNALGKDSFKLDRYCLRHTALTWLVLTPGLTMKQIGDFAGHMGPRMLQDTYASRRVKDQRSWEEAMPLSIRNIPKTWHGYLLECFMLASWPQLKLGKKPDDERFKELGRILKGLQDKREDLDLF